MELCGDGGVPRGTCDAVNIKVLMLPVRRFRRGRIVGKLSAGPPQLPIRYERFGDLSAKLAGRRAVYL